MKKESDTQGLLVGKSIEAFLLAVETYNKPTIKYRVEGFAFFICNAWELMLKARLIKLKGEASVYYKNKPSRTISLNECLRRVFTNASDPLRKNIERINALRNTSAHFIAEEYEIIYAPLFQACVRNFDDKMSEFHGVAVSDHISSNFLTLSMTASPIDPEIIRTKYSPEIAERILFEGSSVLQEQLLENNQRFSVVVRTELAVVKNPNRADLTVRYDKDSLNPIRTVSVFRDPSDTHPFSTGMVVKSINRILEKQDVTLMVNGEKKAFTTHHWDLFCKFYGFKSDDTLSYAHAVGNTVSHTYSQKVIDMIVEQLSSNPAGIISELKAGLKKSG